MPSLSNVSLTIRRGEYVVLCGKSGSGKSTLLNLVAGLESPTDGSINVLGQRIDRMSEIERIRFRRSHIGFVFQSYRLLPQYTAIENVALPLVYWGVPLPERRERARQALDRVGLYHRREHLPGEMSGGQQQRTAIARALVTHPPLLLADEPTGNLDSISGRDVMRCMAQLNESGTTVVLITHDDGVAAQCARRAEMRDGRLRAL